MGIRILTVNAPGGEQARLQAVLRTDEQLLTADGSKQMLTLLHQYAVAAVLLYGADSAAAVQAIRADHRWNCVPVLVVADAVEALQRGYACGANACTPCESAPQLLRSTLQLVGANQLQNDALQPLLTLLDTVSCGVQAFYFNENGEIVDVFTNDRLYRLFGYERAEAQSRMQTVWDTLPPEEGQQVWQQIRDVRNTREPLDIRFRSRKKDGSTLELHCTCMLATVGSIRDVTICALTDVTEQVKLAQERRNSAEQLQALLDNMLDGAALTVMRDGEPEHLLTNERYYELMGYTRASFAAAYPNKFLAVYPPDREQAIALFKKGFTSDKPYENEYRIIHRDGSLRTIHCSVNLLRLAGSDEPVQLAMTRDVTELRAVEQRESLLAERMQIITSNLGCGISVTVADGGDRQLLLANDKFYSLLGYTKETYTEKFGQQLVLADEEGMERIRRQVYAQLSHDATAVVEYPVQLPDHSVRYLRSILTQTRFSDVEQPVRLSTYSDITERRQMQTQLQFLSVTARKLLAQPDDKKAIRETLEDIRIHLGATRAYLFEYNKEKNCVLNTFTACAEGVSARLPVVAVEQSEYVPFWQKTFAEHGCVYLATSELPQVCAAERKMLLAQGVKNILIAPLLRNGIIIGAIGADNPETGAEKTELVSALADYMAVMLTRRDLHNRIDAEAQARYAVMNGIPGGFVQLQRCESGELLPLYFSEGYQQMTGMDNAALRTMCGGDLMTCVHPNDLNALSAVIERMLRGEQCRNFRFRILCASGYLTVRMFGTARETEDGETYINLYFHDVDEQPQTEDLQQALLDNLPCGAALFHYDGKTLRIVHLNRYYWTLVGRPVATHAGATFITAVHPNDRQLVFDELSACLRQNRDYSADIRILYGENSYRAFRLRGKAQKLQDGTYRLYITYTPIEEDTLSEQSLQRIALSALLSVVDDFVFVKDKQLRYQLCNASFVRMVGLREPAQMIGKTDAELFERMFSDAYAAGDMQVLRTGESVDTIEEEGPGLQIRNRQYHTVKYPLRDARGDVAGVLGISRDITDLREAHFELETLLDTIPIGIIKCRADERGTIVYLSSKFAEMLGYTEAQFREKFNNCFSDMIYPTDRTQAMTFSAGAIRIEAADGTLHYFNCQCAELTDATQNSWRYMSLAEITEQRNTEQRLRTSEEELRLAMEQSRQVICRYYVADRSLFGSPVTMGRNALPERLENVPYSVVRNGQIALESVDSYIAFYEGILCGQKQGTVQYRRILNGRLRWVEAYYTTVFADDGKPVSAVISFRDITDQKEHEAMSSLLETALGGERGQILFLLVAGPYGTAITYRRSKQAPGFIPENIGSVREMAELLDTEDIRPEDRETLRMLIAAGLNNTVDGQTDDNCDFSAQNSNGSYWLNLFCRSVTDAHSGLRSVYYILRDISDQKRAERAMSRPAQPDNDRPRVFVRAFGYFDVFINDLPLRFSGRQEKELLAILVDRRGGTLTSQEAAAILWEDKVYDENAQANFRKIAMRLKNILDDAGIGFILQNKRGVRSVDTTALVCDYYEYLNANPAFLQVFRGAYMSNYSWGEETLATLLAGQDAQPL